MQCFWTLSRLSIKSPMPISSTNWNAMVSKADFKLVKGFSRVKETACSDQGSSI